MKTYVHYAYHMHKAIKVVEINSSHPNTDKRKVICLGSRGQSKNISTIYLSTMLYIILIISCLSINHKLYSIVTVAVYVHLYLIPSCKRFINMNKNSTTCICSSLLIYVSKYRSALLLANKILTTSLPISWSFDARYARLDFKTMIQTSQV